MKGVNWARVDGMKSAVNVVNVPTMDGCARLKIAKLSISVSKTKFGRQAMGATDAFVVTVNGHVVNKNVMISNANQGSGVCLSMDAMRASALKGYGFVPKTNASPINAVKTSSRSPQMAVISVSVKRVNGVVAN